MDRDELKVCNCSVCGVLLCGLIHAKYARQHNLQVVAGRILGRPLCPQCIKTNDEPPFMEGLTEKQRAKLGETTG